MIPGPLGVIGKYAGSAIGETAAFAGGLAIGPTLHPLVQALANESWRLHPDVPPSAVLLAQGVAQGQVAKATAYRWASETGYGTAAMDALVQIFNTGPDLGQAMDAWRRGFLSRAEFRTALERQAIEPQWFAALEQLKTRVLDPADLARGIHKGLIPDPGLLAVPAPAGKGKVPAYPVYPIDALEAAAGSGYNRDELGVLVGLQGNPMGAHEAAQATFRGTIGKTDYDRAIAEGNTRNEWGDAIFEQSRAIPSPTNYVEAFVRDWISRDAMIAGAGRHGMTAADTELLFKIHGRGLSWHQVFIGLRRGGTYDGPIDHIDPAFLKSLRESNIRPEWYNLAWAQRFTYPAAFVLKGLTSSGDITTAEAEQILLFEGWEPTLAHKVASAWGSSTPAGPGATVKSHTTSAVRAVAKAYIGGSLTRQAAEAHLTALHVPPADQTNLLGVWDVERQVRGSSGTGTAAGTTGG